MRMKVRGSLGHMCMRRRHSAIAERDLVLRPCTKGQLK